eukprot:TRINITY_DN90867_c0_g1_i1.p1 TRINITY_DN90867_c0_g1~~TRINITY_DN90867_c0_g1_i1.p1  ORF type:complete len:1635 (-),score=258.88 TRINITY_DN90867_c0_g1_i1:70-4905(-)
MRRLRSNDAVVGRSIFLVNVILSGRGGIVRAAPLVVADPAAAPLRSLAGHTCEGFDEEVGTCPPMPACSLCEPINCAFSAWNDWYDAGGCIGLKLRSRTVGVSNNECGTPCTGPKLQSQKSIQPKCLKKVMNCEFAPWSEWTICETREDQSVRSRTIAQPPSKTGLACEGSSKETRPCGAGPDPVHCRLSEWQEWTTCSATCDAGRHTRMRRITEEARHGGNTCQGSILQDQPCKLRECPLIDCEVSPWSVWSSCEEEGQTQHYRVRKVIRTPAGGGVSCPSQLEETGGCPPKPPTDCSLTEWTKWSPCDRTCLGGQSYRERQLSESNSPNGYCKMHKMKETKVCNDKPCYNEEEDDCLLTEWASWGACSAICGQGSKSRLRRVDRPASHKGKGCEGPLEEIAPCEETQCHIEDCKWGEWYHWSACSCSCGGGAMRRSRVVSVAPRNGGKSCPAESKSEVAPCNTQPCDNGCVDAKWGPWQEWSPCSATCSSGFRSRGREVEVQANECGAPVGGIREQFELCAHLPPCVFDKDCKVSEWGEWSHCSCSCFGVRERNRQIEEFATANGKRCDALPLKVIEPCNDGDLAPSACGEKPPEDCVLSDWDAWSPCSLSCGGGQKERKRTLLREPKHRGKACEADMSITMPCNTELCSPVHCQDCVWGAWSDWGDCSRCGGQRFRHRNIMKMPNECGKICHPMSAKEVAKCDSTCEETKYCVWAEWSSSTSCDQSCGASTAVRNRIMILADEPPGLGFLFKGTQDSSCSATQLNVSSCPERASCEPQCVPRDCLFSSWSEWAEPTCVGLCERHRNVMTMNNECGKPCDGNLLMTKTCQAECQIPRDCRLSAWTDWSDCAEDSASSQTSHGLDDVPENQRVRSREVLQRPQNGGKPCKGSLRETSSCEGSVVTDCSVSEWGEWGACSESCGIGYTLRQRQVLMPAQGGGSQCDGHLQEIKKCGLPFDDESVDSDVRVACLGFRQNCMLGEWGDWSGLDADNQRFRSRKVERPASGGGKPCVGSLHETETGHHEKVDCHMSAWTRWDECDMTCDGGQQHRQRQVERFPTNGGTTCPQELMQTRGCNTQPCSRQDAEISEWSDWSRCSSTCGPAMQERSRSVISLRGVGGAGATASLGETRACAGNPECPSRDCAWNDWQDWSDCTCTCDGGQRTRDRVVKIMPSDGGKSCDAQDKEQMEPCNTQKCAEGSCIDGRWGQWSQWGMCSATCGGGISVRHRPIEEEASDCGKPVDGKAMETRFCNTAVNCERPVDCLLNSWGPWSMCTRTCDGIQRRARTVKTYGRGDGAWCMGDLKQTRPCNPIAGQPSPEGCGTGPSVDCKVSEWEAWSTCSATCGGGMHSRERRVVTSAENGGKGCNNGMSEIRECARNDCLAPAPQDCKYGAWGMWGACSKCSGQRLRYRNIIQYADNGGLNCDNADSQEATSCPRKCHTASFCVWTLWEDWQRCTAQCGTGGKRTRRRYLEITTDPTRVNDQLQPAQELIRKYSTLYARTEELQENHITELFVAFGAGCLSLVALLGLGAVVSGRSGSLLPRGVLVAAPRSISRALGLGSESRAMQAPATRSRDGARYLSLVGSDAEEDYDTDDVAVELSLRDTIRA